MSTEILTQLIGMLLGLPCGVLKQNPNNERYGVKIRTTNPIPVGSLVVRHASSVGYGTENPIKDIGDLLNHQGQVQLIVVDSVEPIKNDKGELLGYWAYPKVNSKSKSNW